MFRFLFFMGMYIIVGRWLYSEVGLMAPGAVPIIDKALQTFEIPTHDRWDSDKIHEFVDRFVPKEKGDSKRYKKVLASTKSDEGFSSGSVYDSVTSYLGSSAHHESTAFTKF